jgi:hypothetical protein
MLRTRLGLGAYVFYGFLYFVAFFVSERELGILELTNTMRLTLLEPSS